MRSVLSVGAFGVLAVIALAASATAQKDVPLDARLNKLEANLNSQLAKANDRVTALTARVAALESRAAAGTPSAAPTSAPAAGGGGTVLANWVQTSSPVSSVTQATPSAMLQRASFDVAAPQDVLVTAMVEAAGGSDGGGATVSLYVKTSGGQVRCGTSMDPRGSAMGGVSMFTFPTTLVATCPRLAPGTYVVEVGAGFRPGPNADARSFYSAKFVAGNVVGLH